VTGHTAHSHSIISSTSRVNPWVVAIVVTMATFMEVLDTTIVTVSLPHIAGNLSAGQDESTWVLTSYLVSNAIVLPISGWLSYVVGRKRFYMGCVALFTLSSLLCGLAPNLPALIFFRVLQGIGGGGLQPSEQAILVDTFPPEKRGMAFAVAGIAMVCAPVLGPTLGGWITDSYNWRWVFLINVPVGIVSLLLSSRLLSDPPAEVRRERRSALRMDYVGLALVAIGLACLQIVFDKGEREDWFDSSFITMLAIVAGTALAILPWWELRQRDPVVDIALLRNRNFAIANVLMFMIGFALFGSTVLIPLMLQGLLGYTAMKSGLVLSPAAVTTFAIMPVVGMLTGRVQPRWLIAFGFAVSGLALFHMTGFTLQIDYRHAMLARCFQTFGLAFLFIPINTLAYSGLPPGKNNNASALLNVSRNIGASFGIAMVITMLARRSQFHHQTLVAHLTPFDGNYQAALAHGTDILLQHGASPYLAGLIPQGRIYGELGRQSAMLGYIDQFWTLGWLMLAMVPLVVLVLRRVPLGKHAGGH
jgi:MFS transporter, DHA2 family, multidrug resistance protein